MRIPRAILVFPLFLLMTPRLARAADADIAVTAAVHPASIALKDFKPDKPLGVTVSCTFENRTAVPQVINRFCTLRPGISAGDRPVILSFEAVDGAMRIRPSDIIVIEPGKKLTLELHLGFMKTDKALVITQYTEDGGVCGGGLEVAPKSLDISVLYVNTLDKAAIEKLAPKLAGTKYTLLPDQKFPAVHLAMTE